MGEHGSKLLLGFLQLFTLTDIVNNTKQRAISLRPLTTPKCSERFSRIFASFIAGFIPGAAIEPQFNGITFGAPTFLTFTLEPLLPGKGNFFISRMQVLNKS